MLYEVITAQLSTDFCAICIPIQVGGERTGILSHYILDAPSLPFIHNRHENAKPVKAAGKTGVRIHLHQDLFDLVDGQAGVESLVQRCFQLVRISISYNFV